MTARTAHTFDDELARLDACATAEAVRAGELDPAEVVAAAAERARKADLEINAVVTDDYERAVRTAPTAPKGALAGVPTFIKDMTDVAGLPTRSGSAAFAHAGPAAKTGEIAQQLFDMGAICLGKSSLPEFGFTASTEFPTGEPTRNPWNLDRSAGGSSGGAAALVASGVVPIAHGGDGGGSIRLPASCCGLVGLKATRGRLAQPRQAKLLPVDITVEGVLTRSVRDTALFFAEAERRHRNPKLPTVGHVVEPLGRTLTIGVIHDAPIGVEVDAANQRVLAETVALLEGLGHRTDALPMPVDEQFAADFTHYWAMLAFSVRLLGDRLFDASYDKTQLSDLTNGLADRFRADIAKTPGVIRRIRRSAAEHARIFDRFDVILSPTVAHLAPELGHLGMDLPFDVLFPRVEAWVGFTPLANATGAPSITLPLGHDAATNLPVGMMFGAAHGHEELLLALALQVEQATPWPRLDQIST